MLRREPTRALRGELRSDCAQRAARTLPSGVRSTRSSRDGRRRLPLKQLGFALLLLLTSACSAPPEIVTVSPQLVCPEVVKCHVYVWQIGLPRQLGPSVTGTHVSCRCYDRG